MPAKQKQKVTWPELTNSVNGNANGTWVLLGDNVYDLERFKEEHPGGVARLRPDGTYLVLRTGYMMMP